MSSRKNRNQKTGRKSAGGPTSPAAQTPASPSMSTSAEVDELDFADTPVSAVEADGADLASTPVSAVEADDVDLAETTLSAVEADAMDAPVESADGEASAPVQSPRFPSWAMETEPDAWSASDPSDETEVPSEPLAAPMGGAPVTPEAAWLQDGADVIDAPNATVADADADADADAGPELETEAETGQADEPEAEYQVEGEQSGSPAPDLEQSGAPGPDLAPEPEPGDEPGAEPGLFDPEEGNRWTVVDESAGSAADENDEPGRVPQGIPSAEADAGYGDEGAFGDARSAAAGSASSELPSVNDEAAPGSVPGTADTAGTSPSPHGADSDAAADASVDPNSSADDTLPAFPVPVTMSPKAKKFGWARESLLTGEPAPSAEGAPESRSPRAEKAKNLWRSVRGATAGRPAVEGTGSADVGEHGGSTVLGTPVSPASSAVSGTSASTAPPTGTPSPAASSSTAASAASTGYTGSTAATTASATNSTAGTPGTAAATGTPGTTGTADGSSSASTPEEDGPTGRFHHVLQVLSPYLRSHRAALLTGAIALLLSVWLLVALPFPLKYAVDAAVASTGADLPALAELTGDPGRRLTVGVLLFALLLILQVATRFTAVAALGRVGVRIATSLRSRLLSHLHRLTPGAEGRPSSGASPARQGEAGEDDVVRPLIEDVATLRDLLSHSGPRAAASILTLLTLLVVTVIVAPLGALVLLVTGLLYTAAIGLSMRRSRFAAASARSEARMLADTADELVAATGTVQTYGLETRSSRGLTEAGLRAGRALTRSRRIDSLQSLLTQLVAGIGVVGTLLLCGSRVAADAMTPGDLVLVLVDVLILLVVLRDLLENIGSLQGAPAAGDRIADLLDREAGIAEPPRTQPVDRVGGEIVFSAVNTALSTSDSTAVSTADSTAADAAASTAGGTGGHLFDTVSLVVPSGQHVALLDREGRESAALIAYLLRFDEPDTGRVLLDRYDTRAVSLGDLRRQLAVVQREPVLFTDTVRENIRIGRPDATDDEVREAARKAGIDDVIAQLSRGFDTVLVRRGDVLTDGQRRRVAIARALLRDAPIVVLDAADAGLSGAERRPVLAALAALTEGRTAIVRSRDPETVTAMDRVLWFEGGEVREDGGPSALGADPDSRLATWLRAQDETVS
ncbi:MAG: ABC transporter transmembrane domain-containing protein [Brachybacterium tyrofermentans]|nr:ABC transporter HlyB/MsbA family [Corynebacterium xerosis]